MRIEELEEAPANGIWVTVAEAAVKLGISNMGVRFRYLKHRLPVIKINRIIHVNIEPTI